MSNLTLEVGLETKIQHSALPHAVLVSRPHSSYCTALPPVLELNTYYMYKPAVLMSVYTEIIKSLKCSPDMITTHIVTIPASSSTLIEVLLNPTRIISAGVFGSSNDNNQLKSHHINIQTVLQPAHRAIQLYHVRTTLLDENFGS